MAALSKEFEAANPDVKINFVSSGYDAVSKQLPVQLAVGEGPDIAKITDWQLAPYYLDMRPYMKDAEAFAKLHGASLDQLRLPNVNDPKSINGYMASQTLNLPFVNKTLFEQAGEPLPGPTAKFGEIVEASARVAKATGVQIPFTMDRSGHRFSGGAFSYGSTYVKDGKFSFLMMRRRNISPISFHGRRMAASPRKCGVPPAVRSTRTWETSSSTAMS